MIPQHLNLNQSPSAAPEPIQQTQPEQQKAPEPQQQQNQNYDEQIISEDDLFKQYENDNKIAADAVIDEQTGEVSIDSSLSNSNEPKPPLSDAEASQNTEMLMHMREGLQCVGLSLYVDGTWKESEKYQYPEQQFKKLVEAWRPIIQQSGLRVSPWWNIIMTEFLCTGPLLALAHTSRQQRLQLEESKRIIKAQNEKIKKYEQKDVFEKSSRSPDSQKKWQVDNNGNFTHSAAGVYIGVNSRSEKPNLARDYVLLCKHNDKAFIDKVFKIDS